MTDIIPIDEWTPMMVFQDWVEIVPVKIESDFELGDILDKFTKEELQKLSDILNAYRELNTSNFNGHVESLKDTVGARLSISEG